MEEPEPQTQIVQYRQITGVHLKSGIEDPDFSEDRELFSMNQEHVENIQVEAETVLVDFDNAEGIAIPTQNVSHLDYQLEEQEVPVQNQRRPQGGQGNQRRPRGQGGTQR